MFNDRYLYSQKGTAFGTKRLLRIKRRHSSKFHREWKNKEPWHNERQQKAVRCIRMWLSDDRASEEEAAGIGEAVSLAQA